MRSVERIWECVPVLKCDVGREMFYNMQLAVRKLKLYLIFFPYVVNVYENYLIYNIK